MNRKLILVCMLFLIFISFYISIEETQNNLDTYSSSYFISNALEETGSANIVTGIYLDYRLFDSIFEASILLITVAGAIFMSKKDNKPMNKKSIPTSNITESTSLKDSSILVCISRILYSFMLIFGLYIIIYGHLSPGGGFQGGVILATAILITYFIDPIKIANIEMLVMLEKLLFIGILIISSFSIVTKGILFTNFIQTDQSIEIKRIFLVLLNLFIATKVSLGLVTIFSTFIEEGKS